MKLMSLDYEKDWTPLDVTLDSGIKITSPIHLDGGGLMRIYLVYDEEYKLYAFHYTN
jgi:hypothetical protein